MYLDELVTNKKILKLVCPQHGCGKPVSYRLLKALLSEEMIQKYDRFKKDLEVALDPSMVYCPNPVCAEATKGNKRKKSKTTCEHCQFVFCSKC
jgi:hypothetical protein